MDFFDEFKESEVMFAEYSSSDESVESSDENESDDRRLKHFRRICQANHPRMMMKSMKSHKKKTKGKLFYAG
uniref:Uncharacterized protein n=1 Tax=Chenopodium quinoa TaxID=63459 RepID=A0A803MDS8_CHEQI